MQIHERKVEKFYSYGAEKRAHEADGFLSFGYWHEETKDYHESAENLLELVLAEGRLEGLGIMLNVACGNGAETTRMYERLKPDKIYGIDVTRLHIDTCRKRAADLALSDKLIFQHGDACATGFPEGTFSHVVGIEGPAHFNTREAFFKESQRVLKPGGVLMLTDIIVNRPRGLTATAIAQLCLRLWHMPPENWIDTAEYKRQLERHGFKVEFIKSIGGNVFPGFAAFNVQAHAMRNTVQVRGVSVGVGLIFISWLLGYVYKLGLCDYLIVKAEKLDVPIEAAPG